MTIGMTCPACRKGGALTIDSRGGPTTVRRRRKCQHCQHRWTTYEVEADRYRSLIDAQRAVNEIASRIKRGWFLTPGEVD